MGATTAAFSKVSKEKHRLEMPEVLASMEIRLIFLPALKQNDKDAIVNFVKSVLKSSGRFDEFSALLFGPELWPFAPKILGVLVEMHQPEVRELVDLYSLYTNVVNIMISGAVGPPDFLDRDLH